MNICHVLDTVLHVGTRDKIQSSLRTCSLVEEIDAFLRYKKFCGRRNVGAWRTGTDWGEISKQAFIRGDAKEFGDS